MKFFDDPTLEIIKLNMEEIVATSFGDGVYGEDQVDGDNIYEGEEPIGGQ